MRWDLFDRLVRFEDSTLSVDYAYDPLGRRIHKYSNAHHKHRPEAGSHWNQNEQARKQRELGCGFTLFGWDGDTLAWESSPAQADGAAGKTVHYLYEPGTFVPVTQAMRHQLIRLLAQPNYEGAYDIDQDPLWAHTDFRASTTITKRGCTTTAIGTMIPGLGGLSVKIRSAMRVG